MDAPAHPDGAPAPVAVLGAGSWGTALAFSLAAHGGHPVTRWARREGHAAAIRATCRNEAYLPEALLPDPARGTGDLDAAATGARLWVFATPIQFVRGVADASARPD